MTRSLKITMTTLGVAAAVAVVTAVVVAGAGALGASPAKVVSVSRLSAAERARLSHVSASGVPIALPAGDVRTQRLMKAGFGTVSKLATRGQGSFFRLHSSSGRDCFGSGPSGAAWPFAAITCTTRAPYFPSAGNPLLDQSVVGADAPTEPLRFLTLQGIAADGVMAIKGLDPTGDVVVTADVVDNVYFRSGPDMPENVMAIEAVDAAGNVLQTLPRSQK